MGFGEGRSFSFQVHIPSPHSPTPIILIWRICAPCAFPNLRPCNKRYSWVLVNEYRDINEILRFQPQRLKRDCELVLEQNRQGHNSEWANIFAVCACVCVGVRVCSGVCV